LLQLSSFILSILICTFSFAGEAHWLDSYQLTPLQSEMLLKWEKEQKFEHEKLVRFAENFQKHNLKKKPYVPEHTTAQLEEIARWADGNAFSVFAKFAGYDFDAAAYMDDCPNRMLFNFGYATGTEYFRVDVLARYMQTFDGLQIMYSRHPETFREKFFELAKARGFDIYLSDKIEQVAVNY